MTVDITSSRLNWDFYFRNIIGMALTLYCTFFVDRTILLIKIFQNSDVNGAPKKNLWKYSPFERWPISHKKSMWSFSLKWKLYATEFFIQGTNIGFGVTQVQFPSGTPAPRCRKYVMNFDLIARIEITTIQMTEGYCS